MTLKRCVWMVCAVLASCGYARILPETLLLPQTEFYPLREQDNGLLFRYADQPLLVDPDLPWDPPCAAFETRRHHYWGDWFSQADWDACERLGKFCGVDGHAFFPRPHRARYWDAMEKSPVRGFYEVPIINGYYVTDEVLAAFWKQALRSTRAYRFGGKALILSYRYANVSSPERLRRTLERLRREQGADFLFVCDVSKFFCDTSKPVTESRKEDVRAYLRVADGVMFGDVFEMMAHEGKARIFNTGHYEAVAALLRDVVREPEFAGKKLLGLSACLAHENTTRQFWTTGEDGLRALTESLRIAAAAEPDVILMPEWDEFNENTCVGPTLLNGWSTRRIFNYYQSRIKGRPLAPLAGDDVTEPNLIVSYRRNVSPGGRLVVDVLNVPDGSRAGPCRVGVAVLDETGRTLVDFPPEACDERELKHLRFPVDTAALAERARAPQIRVTWRDAAGKGGMVEEGLLPIDLEPANEWCLKEVHQALRDLAHVKAENLAFAGRTLTGRLACDENIRFAFVCGNGEIMHVAGDPQSPVMDFAEDASNVVFQVYGVRPAMIDRHPGFAYRAKGVRRAAWLDWQGVHAGFDLPTDWIAAVGDPHFLKIDRASLDAASVAFDFGEFFQGEIPLRAAYDLGAYQLQGPKGMEFNVTRMRRQGRYPSVANRREIVLRAPVDADRESMAYCVQVVTMSGKTWRSRPFVKEVASGAATMRVASHAQGRMVDVALPAARIPRIEYDLSPGGGTYLPTKDRRFRFGAVLGGHYSGLLLWNRTMTSSMDFPEGLSSAWAKVESAAPKRVRDEDGTWALEFDGVDDFIAFPWETLPQYAACRVSLELNAADATGERRLIRTKRGLNVTVRGGRILAGNGLAEADTGLSLTPGAWQKLTADADGEFLTVSLDDRRWRTSARLPATFMSPVSMEFKGRVRKIVFDHGRGKNTLQRLPR